MTFVVARGLRVNLASESLILLVWCCSVVVVVFFFFFGHVWGKKCSYASILVITYY